MKKKFNPNLIFTTSRTFGAYTKESDGNAYPSTLDMRDLVLQTEDQGMTSMCAAFTATSWIESIVWRRTGKPINFDPVELYNKAKTIDGMPDSPGTTLDAVMFSMIDLGWLDGFTRDDVKMINNSNQLKRAIHRYGTCLLGFGITDTWYRHMGKLLFDNPSGSFEGGHAVICVGYTPDGVLIQNSWGEKWGKYGFACISWNVFNREFMCGAYIKNCLNNIEE